MRKYAYGSVAVVALLASAFAVAGRLDAHSHGQAITVSSHGQAGHSSTSAVPLMGSAPTKHAKPVSVKGSHASGSGATPGAANLTGAASAWRLVYSTDFPLGARLGSFSGCATSNDTCTGLPKALRGQWWAYADGWPDTATKWHLKVGGYYSPSTTVWIAGGAMNIRLWRGTGSVHSAAVLPRAAIDRMYGKYVETFRVVDPVAGYKSADMLRAVRNPTNGLAYEIDFPEAGWGLPFHAFIHFANYRPLFSADGARLNSTWHTTVVEWTPTGISFYCDGRLIGSRAGTVTDVPMRWVLQNETQTNRSAYPPQNSSSTMQIKYVAYYSWAG